MKIITWNINSVRLRLDRLLLVLERHEPDVLCLQEIKCVEEQFPFEALAEAGWKAAVYGQKSYNGVALLSRHEIEDVERGLLDDVEDPQARLISANVAGVRILCGYFPNGGKVGSDKWTYKLEWMLRLKALLERDYSVDEPLAVCGDFNVVPTDRDVEFADDWADTAMCHKDGRAGLADLMSWGLSDSFRLVSDEAGVYTWWDYRRLGFPRNDGLRIDFVAVTKPLAELCTAARVDRDERKKGKVGKPSDHAPYIAELDWEIA